MIVIFVPNNNIKEREYIIDILLNELLGIEYKFEIKDIQNYEIILKNGNKLIIEDHFFNSFPNDLEYLQENNIPQKVKYEKNEFIIEDNIPIIYGTSMPITNNQSTIICSIDIFASSFFMLTRWEEYVNKNRDAHNRFSAYASLAYKNHFLDRPIVNEYMEMLWNMLLKLGVKQKRKEKQFELILTHDVDDILLFKTYKNMIRRVGGDLLRRKNILLAIKTVWDYIQVRFGKRNDPFDTFDWLMDKSESIGVKSRFYFMSGGVTKYDNRYDIAQQKELIKKIKKRGHIIGFHPSYYAYNNFEQFKKEKELLEKVCECKIDEGREHYLRFEVPTTWQIWEDNGMRVDSTCGYADKEGFRCGTGDEFSVFNILTRKRLNLKEKPLILMEDSFFSYQQHKDVLDSFIKLKDKAKKYKSKFVLLWHNSNLESNESKQIYKKCLFYE